jgi:hypothetical protein
MKKFLIPFLAVIFFFPVISFANSEIDWDNISFEKTNDLINSDAERKLFLNSIWYEDNCWVDDETNDECAKYDIKEYQTDKFVIRTRYFVVWGEMQDFFEDMTLSDWKIFMANNFYSESYTGCTDSSCYWE